MKKFGEYVFAFAMTLLALVGAGTIIRRLGGDTELLLYLLTCLFCGCVAQDFVKDDNKKA